MQLHVQVLDAEREADKVQAMAQLIAHKEAKKDEQYEAVVAVLTAENHAALALVAAKDAELQQLKAKLAER